MSQTEYAVEVASSADVSLIDCDVHNYPNSIDDLMPFLSARWQAYVRQSGFSGPPGPTYPKGFAQAARRDAWPPSGLRPGGDPDFARTQLLDAWGIDVALLNPLYGMTSLHNLDFANALMRAVNEWTAHAWLDHDPRWRGSIVINASDPAEAAAEIKRAAADPRFVQALLLVRSSAPYGKRQFRSIFAAACEVGLPVGIHFGGSGQPITACGWPSYYIEDHTAMSQAFEAQVISLVCEGVFCEFRSCASRLSRGIRVVARTDVAAGQKLPGLAQRGAVAEEAPQRIHPRALPRHDPTHGRARRPPALVAHHRHDRLRGVSDVRHGLSALGL